MTDESTPKRRPGRPRQPPVPDDVKRARAVERANAAKARKREGGKIAKEVWLTIEIADSADTLMVRRNLSSLSELVEYLLKREIRMYLKEK